MDTGRPGPAEAESSRTSSRLSTPALRKVDLPPTGPAQVDKHRRHTADVVRGDRRSKVASSSTNRRNVPWPLTQPGLGRGASESTAVEPDGPGPSDEYDLYPKLFQDIQRALAAKARREARLKTTNAQSTLRDSIPFPEKESASSGSSAPQSVSNNITSSHTGAASDLDFSPSTSLPLRTHPVPTSSDDGVTLDWTGTFSGYEKHERRWTLSISKKKDKGKAPLNSVLIEKQESLHAERIARIKAKVGSKTLRKAAITSGQLQRRYGVLYESLIPNTGPLNLVSVVRWYDEQLPSIKATLEKLEPHSWLRHFEKRRASNTPRLSYHISALIVEEFLRSQTVNYQSMPQVIVSPSPRTSSTKSLMSPFVSPQHSITSLTNQREDDDVSFEPDLSRPDENLSLRSGSGPKGRRVHLSSSGRSSQSSSYNISGPPPHQPPIMSKSTPPPLSQRSSSLLKDATQRSHTLQVESDDGARNSPPEELSGKIHIEKGRRKHSDLSYKSGNGSEMDDAHIAFSGISSNLQEMNSPRASGIQSPHTLSESEPMARALSLNQAVPFTGSLGRSTLRVALHDPDRLLVDQERKRQMHVDEEQSRQEYEVKAQILDDAAAQNHRIRLMWQRIASALKDYDSLHSNLMKSLGLPYRSLPHGLLEAFSHDPSSVTGNTRRNRGWRAVEDIQTRLNRQRDTFRAFRSVAAESGILPEPASHLDEPILPLLQALDELENHLTMLASKASEVEEATASTKNLHTLAKAEYNSTLSHTSAVYHELSKIEDLEESYRDQYKQVWEFGMRALTFLLDTVTPFWRTYGKRIGEDAQDFLIIPWYRNEFTGEPKRYAIERFPKRSLRHWVALVLFFTVSVGVAFLQTRAVTISITHSRLSWITHDGLRWFVMPFYWTIIVIQCCALLLEWSLVMLELGVIAWWIGWLMKINS